MFVDVVSIASGGSDNVSVALVTLPRVAVDSREAGCRTGFLPRGCRGRYGSGYTHPSERALGEPYFPVSPDETHIGAKRVEAAY
ncbi:hypothetical protein HSR122_2012 [Halapricum desulfuricans]|uniref:Uncharacterized protein n=1 Tax=Halapricum desulfuricans TaxID=2841257 RepID=A0A897N9M3_9EURY|nr:hypothetical protein HSR122_2012 [Halapricum desulfuricans]